LCAADGTTTARRNLLAGVACAALAMPALAVAAADKTPVRIGVLHAGRSFYFRMVGLPQALGIPLHELGVRTSFEIRTGEDQPERLDALAAELIAARVDILLVHGDAQAVRAAMRATKNVPIVFLSVGDPVAEGLVQSLGRPGGNVTGLSSQAPELESKRLDLLVQAVPTIRRVAVITRPGNQALVLALAMLREAAARLGLGLSVFDAATGPAMAQVLRSIAQSPVDALMQQDDWMLNDILPQTGVLALERRLPFVAARASHGVLLAYGAADDEERQLVRIIHRLTTGTKPSDLPIEQPTRFTLAINLNVAELLRITIPPAFLLRADRVERW
jgi:putative tryptophan/tyrosine transport system substrate-binding protein